MAFCGTRIPSKLAMTSAAILGLWSVACALFDGLWGRLFVDSSKDSAPHVARDIVTPLKNNEKFTSGGGEGTPRLPDIPPTEDDDEKGGDEGIVSKPSPEDDFAMLAKRFEALKKR
jgi:hypothetical protein